jgi:hypothetical protein
MSLSGSVNNSDVTNDMGEAQEHSSCLWVSEFADDGQDDIVPREHEEQNLCVIKIPKKRKSTAKGNGIAGIVRRKKGKNGGDIGSKQMTLSATSNFSNCSKTHSCSTHNVEESNPYNISGQCHEGTMKEMSSIDIVEEYISQYSSFTSDEDSNNNSSHQNSDIGKSNHCQSQKISHLVINLILCIVFNLSIRCDHFHRTFHRIMR